MRIVIKKQFVFEITKQKLHWYKVVSISPLEFVVSIHAVNINAVREMLKKIVGVG